MKKIIIIGVSVLVLLLIVGVVLFMFVLNPKEKPIVYQEYEFGEMYTNIADEGKILKFSMVVEFTNPEILDKITASRSEIVNNVYELFRTKSYETLNKSNGQQRVRDEIRDMLIEMLESDGETITNVYFLQFITQG
ncbi:MAG: flagellar basal body-associated FliL family protein [Clostridia bacterium]|nr:flagellar basal body-associated FliL family protein [Clostridia bacterium]